MLKMPPSPHPLKILISLSELQASGQSPTAKVNTSGLGEQVKESVALRSLSSLYLAHPRAGLGDSLLMVQGGTCSLDLFVWNPSL